MGTEQSKKPRRTATVIAVVAAILVIAGLGARGLEDRSAEDDVCAGDLRGAFEMCEQLWLDCRDVVGDFKEPCVVACVTSACPAEASALKEDPLWDAACTDLRGAHFWQNLQRGELHCESELATRPSTFAECWNAEVERGCPELIGTGWRAKVDAVLHRDNAAVHNSSTP